MKKGFTVAVISSGVIFCVLFGCGGPSGEKEYKKALSFWTEGNLARARSYMEKSARKLSGNENKSVAQNQLGIILWQLGETDASIKAFGESARKSSLVTEANLNLAIALFHVNRLEEAEFQLTQFLKQNPDHPQATTYRGLVAMKKNDWTSASAELREVLRNAPSNPANQNILAIAELNNNRSDAAITRLKTIISTNPDYAPAAYNLATIYDQWLADDQQALTLYKEYLHKAAPEDPRTQLAQNAIDRLSSSYGRPTRNAELSTRYFSEGASLHKEKKYTQAIEKYKLAVQADPSQKSAYYNMGLSYFFLDDYPAATKACTRALELDSRYMPARYMRAYSLYKEGKLDEAEKEVKMLLMQDPSHAQGKSLLKFISDAR